MQAEAEHLVVALAGRTYRVERPFGPVTPAFGKVTDVACAGDGTVFLLTRCDPSVEARRDCVYALSPAGVLLASWGANRIYDAHKIAVDGQDRVWVVDRDAHEIVVFDRAGTELFIVGARHRPLAPFNHPADIAFAPDGTIVVADGYGGGRIHRLTAEGEWLSAFGDVGVAPGQFLTAHGIAVAADGTILVADRENSRVQVFSADGALKAVWPDFYRPSDIWIDAAGTAFISDGIPTLSSYDAEGRRSGRCRPVLNGGHGIGGDAAGRIYLAEGNPSRLTRLVPLD